MELEIFGEKQGLALGVYIHIEGRQAINRSVNKYVMYPMMMNSMEK